jgi:hypothetical protein
VPYVMGSPNSIPARPPWLKLFRTRASTSSGEVFHVHLRLLAGRGLHWPPGRAFLRNVRRVAPGGDVPVVEDA